MFKLCDMISLKSLVFIFLISTSAIAQVGINTTNPDASSELDINSPNNNKGFLPPRLTTTQRNTIVSPAIGLMVFNTTINCLEWWTGTMWFNACGTNFIATLPSNSLCVGKTISKTPCSQVSGAILNDDATTTLGVEYDWSNATSNILGNGLGATTNTRALVEIGGQCWCRYNIDIANTNLTAFTNTTTSAWSGYYNTAANELAANEGRLFQWPAAMQGSIFERAQGVCPAGFHIPSDCEWMYLESVLGMSNADQQLAFFRNSGAVGSDISLLTSGGTNISGFTGLLAGIRDVGGTYSARTISAYWWSSSENGATNAWHRGVDSSNTGISRGSATQKASGICVRCLKD